MAHGAIFFRKKSCPQNMKQLEMKANFLPKIELQVALGVEKLVLGEKGGKYKVTPAGVDFTVDNVLVASLTREQTGRSTLVCNIKLAEGLNKTGEFGKTGLIFLGPQKKK
jgi:hypothetical protein